MLFKAFGSFLIGISIFSGSLSLAQSEDERRKGFYQKQKEDHSYEQEREAGLKEYLKEQAEWEEQRKKDIAADKSRKRHESPLEGGADYKADRNKKYEDYEEYEVKRKGYIKEKLASEPKNKAEAKKREEWALEEYGLDKERPRFDIAKRNMYGGKGGSSSPSGNFGSGSAPSFPPAPAFDDFGGEGFVPPPFPPADSFEPPMDGGFPPPPPPVPFPEGSNDFDNGDYFPPPPPPIPAPADGF